MAQSRTYSERISVSLISYNEHTLGRLPEEPLPTASCWKPAPFCDHCTCAPFRCWPLPERGSQRRRRTFFPDRRRDESRDNHLRAGYFPGPPPVRTTLLPQVGLFQGRPPIHLRSVHNSVLHCLLIATPLPVSPISEYMFVCMCPSQNIFVLPPFSPGQLRCTP